MKKYGIIALTLVLALSLCACGRRDTKDPTTGKTPTANTVPSTTKMTEMTLPMTIPTVESNIPDPNVDPTSDTMPTTDHNATIG